jgi:rare lipoprotein A
MKISNSAVRMLSALAMTAGLLVPTPFSLAKATKSTDANQSNTSQTETASRSGPRFGRKALTGIASLYSNRFHGRPTASGEPYDMNALTLACRRLPLGTRVRVTNLRNGKSAVGRVNDRGPNGRASKRIADLSRAMARKIGVNDGLVRVRLEVVKPKAR